MEADGEDASYNLQSLIYYMWGAGFFVYTHTFFGPHRELARECASVPSPAQDLRARYRARARVRARASRRVLVRATHECAAAPDRDVQPAEVLMNRTAAWWCRSPAWTP